MSAIDYHIKQAEEKGQEWVEFLATYPDKRLVKRLAIIRKQLRMAAENKDEKGYELMLQWEHITICARMHKEEFNIPDSLIEQENKNQLLETEQETSNSLSEKRQEIITEILNEKQLPQKKQKLETDNDNQLSLF